MYKYYILAAIYLISVASASIANCLNIDVQVFYRLPFLSIRWIDVAILVNVGSFCYSLTQTLKLIKGNNSIIAFCIVYLFFEGSQLIRSWGATETSWQTSGFLCTLNFFVLIDLLTYERELDEVILFLKRVSFGGAIVIIFSNLYLVYSFLKGNVIFTDLDTRVAIEVVGAKETVSDVVLIPFVYGFSLYLVQKEEKLLKKIVYFIAILSILLSLVITFHRGTLVTIGLLTIIYITAFSKNKSEILLNILRLSVVLCSAYFLFGGTLRKKGYDPIDKLSEIVNFTMDVNNPDWDKGRSIPQNIALDAWQKNIWFGVGYNDLYHYGLPEGMGAVHNFVIASLFYRGIIGTMLYLLILIILFRNSIKCWHLSSKEENQENDIVKLLIIVSYCWLIPFWTQDVMWEKYSLSIQFMYLGIISNVYRQKNCPVTINSIPKLN